MTWLGFHIYPHLTYISQPPLLPLGSKPAFVSYVNHCCYFLPDLPASALAHGAIVNQWARGAFPMRVHFRPQLSPLTHLPTSLRAKPHPQRGVHCPGHLGLLHLADSSSTALLLALRAPQRLLVHPRANETCFFVGRSHLLFLHLLSDVHVVHCLTSSQSVCKCLYLSLH